MDKKYEFVQALQLAFKTTAYMKSGVERDYFEKFYVKNLNKTSNLFFDQREAILVLRSFTNTSLNHLNREKKGFMSSFYKRKEKLSLSSIIGDVTNKIGCPILIDNMPFSYDLDVEHGVPIDSKITFLYLKAPNWFEGFKHIASNAYCIFLIPDTSEGLRKEIEFLIDCGLLNKVLILMPPTLVMEQSNGISTEAAWNFTKLRLSKHGYHIPEYNSLGGLYIPDESLAPKVFYTFLPVFKFQDLIPEFEAGIHHLLEQIPHSGTTISQIIDEIKDLLIYCNISS